MNDDLSDFSDTEIEDEYIDRGLRDLSKLDEYEDDEIESEFRCRNLSNFEELSVNSIVNLINQGKPCLDKIRDLLEKASGKLITKQIK